MPATNIDNSPTTGGSLPRAAAWALLLCSSLTVLSGAIIAPALPLIAEEFRELPNVDFLSRLVITMPALAIALAGMLSGLLADRIGRRPLLFGALTLYAIAGTSGLYLSDLYAILAGRFPLGVAVAVMTLGAAVVSLNFARLVGMRSPSIIACITACVMGVGCLITGAADSLPLLLVGQLIFGAGAGLIMPNLMSWLLSVSPESRRGQLTGTLTAAIFAGQFLSPIAAQPLVHAHGVPGTFTHFAFMLFALAAALFAIRVAITVRGFR